MSTRYPSNISSGSFTRPADTTQYASGDLVGNDTTAGDVAAVELTNVVMNPGGGGDLIRVWVRKSGTSTTSASFRVHLYTADPTTVSNGDNGVFSTSGAADYIGQVDVTVGQAFTDGAAGHAAMVGSFRTKATTRSIFALLEARATYTPASAEVFTIAVEVRPQ